MTEALTQKPPTPDILPLGPIEPFIQNPELLLKAIQLLVQHQSNSEAAISNTKPEVVAPSESEKIAIEAVNKTYTELCTILQLITRDCQAKLSLMPQNDSASSSESMLFRKKVSIVLEQIQGMHQIVKMLAADTLALDADLQRNKPQEGQWHYIAKNVEVAGIKYKEIRVMVRAKAKVDKLNTEHSADPRVKIEFFPENLNGEIAIRTDPEGLAKQPGVKDNRIAYDIEITPYDLLDSDNTPLRLMDDKSISLASFLHPEEVVSTDQIQRPQRNGHHFSLNSTPTSLGCSFEEIMRMYNLKLALSRIIKNYRDRT